MDFVFVFIFENSEWKGNVFCKKRLKKKNKSATANKRWIHICAILSYICFSSSCYLDGFEIGCFSSKSLYTKLLLLISILCTIRFPYPKEHAMHGGFMNLNFRGFQSFFFFDQNIISRKRIIKQFFHFIIRRLHFIFFA